MYIDSILNIVSEPSAACWVSHLLLIGQIDPEKFKEYTKDFLI